MCLIDVAKYSFYNNDMVVYFIHLIKIFSFSVVFKTMANFWRVALVTAAPSEPPNFFQVSWAMAGPEFVYTSYLNIVINHTVKVPELEH